MHKAPLSKPLPLLYMNKLIVSRVLKKKCQLENDIHRNSAGWMSEKSVLIQLAYEV